jgi:hypothetical protein
MNYIAEIKAFYDWLETNKLPTSSIVLWHALMHMANKTGWQDNFAVAVSVLEIRTGLKRQAIYDARNKLKSAGLLKFESRNGNQSAIYTIIPFVSVERTQEHTQYHTQKHTQTHTQTPTINKLNETKLNNKDISTLNPSKGKGGGKFNRKDSLAEQIKAYSDNKDLQEALLAFAEMRKNQKKSLTDHAVKLLLAKLDKLADNEADKIEIVNNSVTNCWQGFYELKDQRGQRAAPQRQSIKDFMADMLEDDESEVIDI